MRTLFASAANWARHRAYSRHISESMTAGSCTSTELFVSNFIFHGSAKVDGSLRQPSRQPGNLKRPPSSLSTSNAAGLPEIGRRCEATRDVGLWVGLYFCTFFVPKDVRTSLLPSRLAQFFNSGRCTTPAASLGSTPTA